MKLVVKRKSLSKKGAKLAPTAYELPDGLCSLRQLLEAVVEKEVALYNEKDTEQASISFFSHEELEASIGAGKVGFGRVFSEKKADLSKAKETALQCWKDGLVRVFLDDRELTELDETIQIRDGGELTFLRLSFLTGRMW